MAHDLAFIGFGVILPQEDNDKIYDLVDNLGLHVDDIEYAYGVDENDKCTHEEESVYIVTYAESRKEIYDCNFGLLGWLPKIAGLHIEEGGNRAFAKLAESLEIELDPKWIIAQYRM